MASGADIAVGDDAPSHAVPSVGRRGRPRHQLPALPTSEVLAFPARSNPRDWLHRHPLVDDSHPPLNWRCASHTPVLGRAMLDAVHAMSGADGELKTYSSAKSCLSLTQPFFNWLRDLEPGLDGKRPGEASLTLPPSLFADFKRHIDQRVATGLKSKTGYKYKGEAMRLLRHIWRRNNAIFGPGWTEGTFQNDEFIDDHTCNEPYSPAEAKRIVELCAGHLVRRQDATDADEEHLAELCAYTILGLKLGIEPECLDRLTFGDVKPDGSGGRMRVRYYKPRGGGTKSRVTDPSSKGTGAESAKAADEDAEEVVTTGTTMKDAAGVLAFLRDKARARHGEHPPGSRDLAKEKLFSYRMDQYAFRHLTTVMAEAGLKGDDGEPLRLLRPRFRPTWRGARTIKHGGRLSIDQRDNSKDVRARHYLENEHLRPHHENAVLDAQRKALEFALRPTVIDLPSTAGPAAIKKAAEETGLPVADIAAAVSGETDVWLASCKGFTKSPFDPEGKPCSRPFYGCVLCSNAIVTRRSLPMIMAFREHIAQRRSEMPTGEWELMFGRAYQQIETEILPKFPPEVLAEAKRVMRGMDMALHIPPEMAQ